MFVVKNWWQNFIKYARRFFKNQGATIFVGTVKSIHTFLGHFSVTRLMHFVRSKNFNYSIQEVHNVCFECKKCFLLKPNFYTKSDESLMKTFQPQHRISVDFKGPLKSSKYFFFDCHH